MISVPFSQKALTTTMPIEKVAKNERALHMASSRADIEFMLPPITRHPAKHAPKHQ